MELPQAQAKLDKAAEGRGTSNGEQGNQIPPKGEVSQDEVFSI